MTNPTLFHDIAAAAISGWSEARRTADILKDATKPQLADANAERSTVIQALMRAATDDKPDFNKILAAHRAAQDAVTHGQRDWEVLRGAANNAELNVTALEKAGTAELVKEIRYRVEAIEDKVTELTVWPATAQDAINGAAIDEFSTLQKAEAEFYAIVEVYKKVAGNVHPAGEMRNVIPGAFVADPLTNHPFFIARRKQSATARFTAARDGVLIAAEAWANDAPATPFGAHVSGTAIVPEGASPSAWFRHLAQNQILTVHAPEHAAKLWDAALRATEPFNELNILNHLAERAAYYRLTDDRDQYEAIRDMIPKRQQGILVAR